MVEISGYTSWSGISLFNIQHKIPLVSKRPDVKRCATHLGSDQQKSIGAPRKALEWRSPTPG
jgi:hypothetical protein